MSTHKIHPARIALKFLVTLLAIASSLLLCAWTIAWLSLPTKGGSRSLKGLCQVAKVSRDGESIVQIEAKSRVDMSQTLGFVHAQERFFQMDLLRRAAAGELSELFGNRTLDIDRQTRLLGLRAVAQEVYRRLGPLEKSWVEAYTRGVNQGLASLLTAPPEYWLLNMHCTPWKPEDTFLVSYNLFVGLQDTLGSKSYYRGILYSQLPQEVADFFAKNGSAWEAALDESHPSLLPIPNSQAFAYLKNCKTINESGPQRDPAHEMSSPVLGSNCWALTADQTKSGRALLASDMHLRLGIPNIWYRAQLRYPDNQGKMVCLDGATLPGVPALIMGSNGRVAWGFTSSQINTVDLLTLHVTKDGYYSTDQGLLPLETTCEKIKVKGEPDFEQVQRQTIWGPLLESEFEGKALVARWVARKPEALNLNVVQLETALDVPDAIHIAKRLRTPALNFFAADLQGRIGWTLSGSIPDRDYSAALPRSSELPGWKHLLPPEKLPSKILSEKGVLWNCNNRMQGDVSWERLGNENMANGIRAFQVKQTLKGRSDHTAEQMLQLQMCEQTPFLDRWHRLLLDLVQGPKCATLTEKGEVLKALESWDGRCSSTSVGYPLLRKFRERVGLRVLRRLLHPCYQCDPDFSFTCIDIEEPLWLLVSRQPEHLISPHFDSWDSELAAALAETISSLKSKFSGQNLDQITWGECQKVHIHHPLSYGGAILTYLFDIPAKQLGGGDAWVPKVLISSFGASQRMVVSPGDEEKGLFLMPCGQSGHFLSKDYSNLHPYWLMGRARPLQPGPIRHLLTLKPAKSE